MRTPLLLSGIVGSTLAVMSEPAGIHVGPVTAWLESHVAGAVGPFEFTVIAGGHSNLTFRVTGSDGRRLVLRRPPLGHVLASAHDMGREHRILAALQGSDVPVPPVRGWCDDPSVNDAPFYVMDFVDGHVVRDLATAEHVLTPTARERVSRSLVDTMAHLHSVDIEAVGLADLARHDGYIERQLKRWYGQWNQQKTRELPAVDRVHDALADSIPEQGPATIVHGDYRLDNTLVDGQDPGRIAAVLDWELATLGDPLVDVASLVGGWDGGDGLFAVVTAPPGQVPHFPPWTALADRYSERTGRSLDDLPWHLAFLMYKGAVIFEGIYCRYVRGQTVGDGYREIGDVVPAIVEAAHAKLG
jgi:aminoglycoside phosphotransferase (APT) family kinase protein